MRISEQLQAARDYMANHGFSPYFGRQDCSRCFLGSLASVVGHAGGPEYDQARFFFLETIFDWHEKTDLPVSENVLQREEWNGDDALAAFDIAIACAVSEGK